MPKKQMTPEERKAWGAKMKSAREAKKNKEVAEEFKSAPSIDELVRQIEELKRNQFFSQPQPARAVTKYSINPKDYPDPRERLSNETRLETEAFKQNFLMEWQVGRVSYDAKDGVNYTEPKFKLELWRWIRNPKTNEITNKRFLVKKVTLFEDPDAAIYAAHEAGVEVPPQMEPAFLDEMRYLRLRDWVFDVFWPQPAEEKAGIREEVIGNRVVQVLETSSNDAIDIPFDKL